MRTVQTKPEKCYVNGKQAIATRFNVVSISDDLFSEAQFKYTLLDDNNNWCGEAVYKLSGLEMYQTWDATAEGAYRIVAEGVGLEIVPMVGKPLFNEG
jgi:hypothetical protein